MSLQFATTDTARTFSPPGSATSCSNALETSPRTPARASSRCTRAGRSVPARLPSCRAEFGLPSRCVYNLACAIALASVSTSPHRNTNVRHAPTRPASCTGPLVRSLFCRRPVRHLAWIWWTRVRRHLHYIFRLFRRDAAVRRARCTGVPFRALRHRGCLPAERNRADCILDLRDRHKYFRVFPTRRGAGFSADSTGPRGHCKDPGSWRLARLRHHWRHLGRREVFALTLAVAISRRATRVCVHRASRGQRGANLIHASPQAKQHRLQHRLGPSLELLRSSQLCRVWRHRYSPRHGYALHSVRTALV